MSHCLPKNYNGCGRILKWKPKLARFFILNTYKCKPKDPNEITYFSETNIKKQKQNINFEINNMYL